MRQRRWLLPTKCDIRPVRRYGHQVDEILRESPDRGRVPEQLMRVEIEAPVIAIPEIEVAIQHQHLELLQVLQRLVADLVLFAHQSGIHSEIPAAALT